MTEKEQRMINYYNRSNAKNLNDVYGSFSKAKAEAFNMCLAHMHKNNGFDGRICSHNGWKFTFGYKYVNDLGYTTLCFITPHHTYYITL